MTDNTNALVGRLKLYFKVNYSIIISIKFKFSLPRVARVDEA